MEMHAEAEPKRRGRRKKAVEEAAHEPEMHEHTEEPTEASDEFEMS